MSLIISFLLIAGAVLTVGAADKAAPGDPLYPVDLAVEDFRMRFASDSEKVELYKAQAEERLAELKEKVDESETAAQYRETSLEMISRLQETGAELAAQGNELAGDEVTRIIQEIGDLTRESFEIEQADVVVHEDGTVETILEAVKEGVSSVVAGVSVSNEDGEVTEVIETEGDVSVERSEDGGTVTVESEGGVTTISAETSSSDGGTSSVNINSNVSSSNSHTYTSTKKSSTQISE